MKCCRSEKEQKKLADDARLLRWWKAVHREKAQEVRAGPHGIVVGELLRMFENLALVQPVQLLGYAGSIDWSTVDFKTRLVLLHEFNLAVMKLREKRGLEPIDDNLPGEPETPYRMLKVILFPPPQEGAHRGAARPE